MEQGRDREPRRAPNWTAVVAVPVALALFAAGFFVAHALARTSTIQTVHARGPAAPSSAVVRHQLIAKVAPLRTPPVVASPEAHGEHRNSSAPGDNASRIPAGEDCRLDASGDPDSDSDTPRATKAPADGRDPDRGGGAGDPHDGDPDAVRDSPDTRHADADPHGNHAASSSHDDDRQAPAIDPDDPLGPAGETDAGPQEQIRQKRLRDTGDRLWKRLGDPVDRRLSAPETSSCRAVPGG